VVEWVECDSHFARHVIGLYMFDAISITISIEVDQLFSDEVELQKFWQEV
jgi:hypothetical protein